MNAEHDVSVNPDKIRNAVAKMLEVNFSIQPDDRVLVLTDFPDTDLLKKLSASEMEAQLQRSMLARGVYEIAKLALSRKQFRVLAFPSHRIERHGASRESSSGLVDRGYRDSDNKLLVDSHEGKERRNR